MLSKVFKEMNDYIRNELIGLKNTKTNSKLNAILTENIYKWNQDHHIILPTCRIKPSYILKQNVVNLIINHDIFLS